MAWRFQPGEELAAAFRRVAAEEVARVHAGLKAREENPDVAIHGARQGFKRLRALLRLARPTLGPSYATENRRWRDAGRHLASLRDGAVLRQAFDKAAGAARRDLAQKDIDDLRAAVMGTASLDAKGIEKALRGALAGLRGASGRLAKLEWPRTMDELRHGLKASQARLRKSWRAARRNPTAESLHDWRKRTKDQSAQLRLFRSAAPDEVRERREVLKDIAELLGEEHDLCILAGRLSGADISPASEKARALVLAAVEKRRKSLRRRALKAADGVGGEKPKALAATLADAWEQAPAGAPSQAKRNNRPEA